ncbi:hypothetical protein AB0B89_19335 [Sphaerisporangium sp. NPDC049002]
MTVTFLEMASVPAMPSPLPLHSDPTTLSEYSGAMVAVTQL